MAQADVEKIKNDPNYVWGEGYGADFDEADEDALAAMSRSIWTVIVRDAEDVSNMTETDGNVSEEIKSKIFSQSFTMNTIPNSRSIIVKTEPEYCVFRYVSKKDIDDMKAQKVKHIQDYVATGKRAESRLQVDDALRCYYWALMLAQASMDPVMIDTDEGKVDARTYLPTKVKSVISNIKAELVECSELNGRYPAKMKFTYGGHDVSSLQVYYNDEGGNPHCGPVVVRDGVGEFELVQLPVKKKIRLSYEYRFKDEASNLDKELEAAFQTRGGVPQMRVNSLVEVPVKVSKGNMEGKGEASVAVEKEANEQLMAPEAVRVKKRDSVHTVADDAVYAQVMADIENAIKQKNPALAKQHFDENFQGYDMFETLLTKSGTVTLVGKQEYEFVQTNDLVLARFCRVKMKHRNGKTFMENIVFRFLPSNGKIESLAMALTKKADDDIFAQANHWPEVSKYTIQRFMEDYQTAYALKRLDYIESIFSDDAIIVHGSVLTKTNKMYQENEFKFKDAKITDVKYTRQTKDEFLKRLARQFKDREYIHLTFEDNTTSTINTQGVLKFGSAFSIQIKQIYTSPVYSDRGYLSLVLNMRGKTPVIEVRFWQPESDNMITTEEFLQAFPVN